MRFARPSVSLSLTKSAAQHWLGAVAAAGRPAAAVQSSSAPRCAPSTAPRHTADTPAWHSLPDLLAVTTRSTVDSRHEHRWRPVAANGHAALPVAVDGCDTASCSTANAHISSNSSVLTPADRMLLIFMSHTAVLSSYRPLRLRLLTGSKNEKSCEPHYR